MLRRSLSQAAVLTALMVLAAVAGCSAHHAMWSWGAHLDSVPGRPGDDNGSGVAAVLETAVQMGSSPPVNNAVRFAGAEELGLVGSDSMSDHWIWIRCATSRCI